VKRYQLLVAWSVVSQLRGLSPRIQRAVHTMFSRLEETPDLLSEFQIIDGKGRQLDAFVCEDFVFYYWIDFSDRHVKVLTVEPADR
jgi:hypothetical protein